VRKYDCRPRMQRMSVIASFQKCPRGGMVTRQDPRRGSDRVRSMGWSQFSKNARLVGRLGSGPCLVGRVGSEVRVSDSFHILSCADFWEVARSLGQVLLTPL